MFGDYENGFYCAKPDCLAVLKSKRDKPDSSGRVDVSKHIRGADKIPPKT